MPICECGQEFVAVTNRRWCSKKCPAMERHRYQMTRAWYLRVKAGPRDTERICDCGAVFAPRFGGRPQRFCGKKCPARRTLASKRSINWYTANRAYATRREQLRRSGAPEKIRAAHLKTKGMAQNIYEAWLKAQGGVCAICHSTTPSRRRKFFDIDHDHITGTVRGLLCETCNRALGLFKDDPKILSRAICYLSTHQSALPFVTVP
jgi:hypothetical protein